MKGLLKFLTCGSVDDGKSTLIGHLLYDAKCIYTDQQKALELDSKLRSVGGELDYSLLLDGLMAEREQGITIDVAYRYFSTEKRSFIVADAPGHEEYTRNMAVGAAFADLAVILVDVTQGVLPQTRHHATICSLMGITSFVFAVNKMDLVNYEAAAFTKCEREIKKLAIDLGLTKLQIIPLSAKAGDNITVSGTMMPWYKGAAFLPYLEEVEIDLAQNELGFVLPIQRVSRPNAVFRGFQGEVVAGRVSLGTEITVLPQEEKARVENLLVAGKEKTEANVGEPVTICLDREVDVSRGSVLMNEASLRLGNMLVADILWMDETAIVPGRNFWCQIGTKRLSATVLRIKHRLDIQTGEKLAATVLTKNAIGAVEIALAEKTVFTEFTHLKALGSFILIDRVSYNTVACGMIRHPLRRGDNLTWQETDITRDIRAAALGQQPKTIWFTGLSGAGKTTLANALEKMLHMQNKYTMLLDGDNIRLGLNSNLGFSEQDRIENIRRIAEVAKLMNDAGLIVLTAFISPYRQDREGAREIIGAENFIEVYVNTPIDICEKRDVKGLYAKARQGKIPNFTGITAPYESPLAPTLTINTANVDLTATAEKLLQEIIPYLEGK